VCDDSRHAIPRRSPPPLVGGRRRACWSPRVLPIQRTTKRMRTTRRIPRAHGGGVRKQTGVRSRHREFLERRHLRRHRSRRSKYAKRHLVRPLRSAGTS
jgi:hypothetical protein